MSLEKLRENRRTAERLSRAVRAGQLSHAYLFEGDTNTDKLAFAKEFIKAVLCEEAPGYGCDECVTCRKIDHDHHEDVVYAEGLGKTGGIVDEEIEEIQYRLKMKPNEKRNIAVIPNADTMTDRAQNRFLKTLEEPPEGTIIILLTENKERLLPTIVSRCVCFSLQEADLEADEKAAAEAAELCSMLFAGKPFYETTEKADKLMSDKDSALFLLDGMENYIGDIIRNEEKLRNYKRESIYHAVDAVEEARQFIKRGVSYRYAVNRMILQIGG
ncbi:MAG: hypothetical protein IKS63_04225 [Firmicutes bacterium]|nr:hypothetical protein [Bacillota bacterium]